MPAKTEHRDGVAVVVTTIARRTQALDALAEGCRKTGWGLYVAGDRKTPADFALDGARYLDVAAQEAAGFACGRVLPFNHYARKNIAYLAALRDGAAVLAETDDDNAPLDAFFADPRRHVEARVVDADGWVNVYRYYADGAVWPRGLPLDAVLDAPPDFASAPVVKVDAPIQQYMADDDPDVDAIFRLTVGGVTRFRRGLSPLALGAGAACPFNSQNTLWWREAAPLMYLPSLCSFRMTDIWRGFVAQRVAWAQGWSLLFGGPTVRQERNEHDLMRDFAQEVDGYLCNRRLMDVLRAVDLAGVPPSPAVRACYQALVDADLLPPEELTILDAWLADLAVLGFR